VRRIEIIERANRNHRLGEEKCMRDMPEAPMVSVRSRAVVLDCCRSGNTPRTSRPVIAAAQKSDLRNPSIGRVGSGETTARQCAFVVQLASHQHESVG
jgi:hypothetical protein